MIVESVVLFALGAFAIVFNAMFVGFIASKFLSEDKAKIAAFAFTLGAILHPRLGQFGASENEVALLMGGMTGLILVGIQFFWKGRAHV